MKYIQVGLKVIVALAIITTAVAAGLAYLFYADIKETLPNRRQTLEIAQGKSTTQIAQNLKSVDVIKSEWSFLLLARMADRTIRAGYYDVPANTTTLDLYKQITSGNTKKEKVTIPEGYRTEQIAQVLEKKKLVSAMEFIEKAKKYEGKLFPDTYFFPADVTVEEIINEMVANYEKRTAGMSIDREDLIIASIVEREAINDKERALIAGVYKNRIKIRMPLQADPTVQYGKDDNELKALPSSAVSTFDFWSPITLADYQSVNSPYNTYKIASLPPGPICNPGLASIEGTLNYERHSYYYFLQNGGEIYPARTEAEHNANRTKVFGSR